jgi:hypothetical protein
MEELIMRNYRGRRRAPINVRNNVRVEPVSIVVLSTEYDSKTPFSLIFSVPEDIVGKPSRISSLILPETISSVTDG